jgi:CHAT domain-containing protein/lipopolysaccharide biosynthesis regulator YciM
MQRFFGMMVVMLCCAAGAPVAEEKSDARLQEAQTALNEANKLRDAGKYADAIAKGEQALVLWEAVLGSSHPDVATCLDTLGGLHGLPQGNAARAELLLQRALAIREATLGKQHPDVAQTLNRLASFYATDRAEPLLLRALAIREAAFGENHPLVAEQLDYLAGRYAIQGSYARAEPLFLRALAIREATFGKSHLLVAESLEMLDYNYRNQGLYARAEPLQARALAIREAALDKASPDVADALYQLASHYISSKLDARAEPLLQRALTIREAALGGSHPLVADALTNLGDLYLGQGLYGRAEPLHERALVIREATYGRNHMLVAESLARLSRIYMAQGLYDRAEPLLQRMLAISQTDVGLKLNPHLVGRALSGLGVLYQAQGLYDRAEPLLQRALAISEATQGKSHYVVSRTLSTLGNLYRAQGLYRRAEPLLQRALAVAEASVGKNHPSVHGTLDDLADLYSAQGLYDQATPLYERALATQEATLGKNHPSVVRTLNHLAVVRLSQRRLAEALPLFTRAFTISEQRLRQESLGFSAARLASFLQFLRTDEERLYALLRAHPEDANVRRLALGAALLFKGRSVEASADISRAVYRSLSTQDRDTFERLRGLRSQLAQLSLQDPGSLPLPVYQQRLEALSEQGDALEADLARRSAPLRALAALPSPSEIVDQVAAALPRDSALVEFISYWDRPLLSKAGASKPHLRYQAMVLMPDASIRTVDLGPAEPIDAAASRLRDVLANRDAGFLAPAQALYQLAFQPLLPLLGNTHRLFLSPDGQLALVPFAALHDGQHFLIDAFDFTYLPSGRDLLPRAQESAPPDSVIVLADPDFSAPLSELPHSMGKASGLDRRTTADERDFSTLRAHLSQRDWAPTPLPGTRQEAEAIQRLLPQAQLFLGPEATKERLLNLPPPGILHLATHGFFLEDAPQLPASRAVVHFGALGDNPPALSAQDPLVRSGLVLAGTSAMETSGVSPAQSSPEHGLVTALELAGLNLWGTQLVVLSACDTGRGDVKLGQGVYGLRSAFLVAGAETVVMSLWKVNDGTTRALMEAYYRYLLAGEGRATALREAMRQMRLTQPHPYYWAPFLAMGRETPLRLPHVQRPGGAPVVAGFP